MTDAATVPAKAHVSRLRRRLVFGTFGLVLFCYAYRELGLPLPSPPKPSRTEANARMVAVIEGLGGQAYSDGFDGGFAGFGRREAITASLDGAIPSDDALAQLADVATEDLRTLSIRGAGITPAGLGCLSRLRGLRDLVLGEYPGSPRVTDAMLPAIGKLQGLERLSLEGTGVTGAEFGHLKALKRLRHLSLSGSNVSDENLARLAAALPGLTTLELDHTPISDAGVKNLAPMRLANLSISFDPGLTKAGLAELEAMTSLRRLGAEGSGFVRSDFAKPRRLNPDLRIKLGVTDVIVPANPRP